MTENYTPQSTEEFRRVQYVGIVDGTSPLCDPSKVYPIYQWQLNTDNKLVGVTISPDGGRTYLPVNVDKCRIFLSSDKQILKVLRKDSIMPDKTPSEAMRATAENQKKNGSNLLHLTFSEMWSFRNCRQRWAYSYRDLVAPKITAPALYLGKLFHEATAYYYHQKFLAGADLSSAEVQNFFMEKAQEQIIELRKEYPDLEQNIADLEFQQNLGCTMVAGYFDFATQKDQFTVEPLSKTTSPIEAKFLTPVITPNGNPSTRFRFNGRIDGIVKYLGHYWVHEVKTSKMWNDGDVDLLPIDPQCLGYVWAAQKHFNIKIAGTIYSVALKSNLRQGKNETLEGFRSRVIKDYAQRPEFYFRRHPIYTDPDNVTRFADTLWEIAKDMSSPRIYKAVGKSTCGFGCPFRRLCTATSKEHHDDVLNTFYRKKTSKHEELEN